MISHVLAIYLLLIATVCCALPKEIKKCHYGDNKCIIDSMNYVISHYPKGIPEIDLKPIDVVDIKDTEILKTERVGATWLNINMTNQVNYGFENTTITHVDGFEKNPTSKNIIISGHIPSLVHKGNLEGSGRIWLVEMNGTGDSISDFQNMKFTLKLKVIPEYRNNKLYIKIYELVPIVKIDRWILWLNGLFQDNSDLTISVNRLMNKHWVEIWNEWEPTILETFASVFTGMIKDIFERVPYEDMFLPAA